MSRCRHLALAALSLLASRAHAQEIDALVSYIQLEEGCVREVVAADFDGDGKRDIIVSVGPCARDDLMLRRLQIHLRRTGRPTFAGRPDYELPLVRDVVAFAVGDVHENPGSELILFSPNRGVAVFWTEGRKEPSYAAVSTTQFLWQPASTGGALPWQAGVKDIDGNGLDDLLLPERDGYRVLSQTRDAAGTATFAETFLDLPPRPVSDRERAEVRLEQQSEDPGIRFGQDDGMARGHLLEVGDFVPAPRLVDWDGDGDLDVCALSGLQLLIWRQGPEGTFPAAVSETYTLPERRVKILNLSYSVRLADLDGDRRPEVLLVSSRSEDDEVTSIVEVYRQNGGAMFEKPVDKMRLRGFVNVPELDDVDGDGKPDLAIGSLRPDLIDTLAGGSSGRVEAQLNLFRGRFTAEGGRFQRPVALVQKIQLEAKSVRRRKSLVARFSIDVDGNGLRDVLLRTDRGRLVIRPTSERGRGLRLGEPVWQLKIDENAQLEQIVSADTVEILVRERKQVVHVEIR